MSFFLIVTIVNFRVFKTIREYGRLKRTHVFCEDEENKLYRKFLDTWKDYYTRKKEKALIKSKKKLEQVNFYLCCRYRYKYFFLKIMDPDLTNKIYSKKAQTYFEVDEDFDMAKEMTKIKEKKRFQRKLKDGKIEEKCVK